MASGLCRGKFGYICKPYVKVIQRYSNLIVFIEMQHAQETMERPETLSHRGLVILEKSVLLTVPV